MQNPYISVITPCYNGAGYIESAILSVLNQPYVGIEHIIIDDGSTDDTQKVCEKYAGKVRYIKTENLGAGHARNIGMEQARGTWILFLDADDLMLHNSFTENTICELRRMESEGVDIIYTPRVETDMELQKSINVYLSEPQTQIRYVTKNSFCTYLIQSGFLKEHKIRFFEYKAQDIETAFRYLVLSNHPKIVTRNDIRFFLQRVNYQSNTHTWNKQTLYGVKAQVYFDLMENHSKDLESKVWTFETVIEQLRRYYIDLIKNGCDKKTMKKKINVVFRSCFKQNLSVYKAIRYKRHFISNIFLYLAANSVFAFKKTKTKKNTGKKVSWCENSEKVLKQLTALSEFVRS